MTRIDNPAHDLSRAGTSADFAALDRVGLNLQAVFDLPQLPAALLARLAEQVDLGAYGQLILIANAGPALWQTLSAALTPGEHPIDDYSVQQVEAWFAERCGDARCERLYPGEAVLDLQALGRLAGWHHPSPLKIGIHPEWGTWFGYRVVLLADTALPASSPLADESPCAACAGRPCISACPAEALAGGEFSLARCIAYRREPNSRCASTCLARLQCPVGVAYRYDPAHIRHSYAESLRAIERYWKGGA